MNDFEELARRSAGSIHTATDELPVTDLADRPSGGPVILGGLALATLLVLVGLFSWSAFADDNAETEIGPFGTDDEVEPDFDPDFRLEWTDPALPLQIAIDLDEETLGEAIVARTTLYESTADDLMIIALRDADPPAGGADVEPGEGLSLVDREMAELGMAAIGLISDGTAVTVVSKTLTVDDLHDVADGLVVEGLAVTGVADEFTQVASQDAVPFSSYRIGGWVAGWATEGLSVFVTGAPGGQDELRLMRYVLGVTGIAEPISVRGANGWLFTAQESPTGPGSQLVWLENGWIVHVVMTHVLDPADVLGDLMPIGAERWQELLDSLEDLRRLPPPGVEVVASGELDLEGDLVTWHLTVDDESALCFETVGSLGSGMRCAGGLRFDPQPIALGATSNRDDYLEAFGVVDSDVATLVLERPDGSSSEVDIHVAETMPRLMFALAELFLPEATADRYTLVAYDESGVELGRVEVGRATATVVTPSSGMVAYGLDDGVSWTVSINDGDVCLDASGPSESAGVCSADEALLQVSVGESVVFGGVVPPCVVAIEFDPDGERGTGDQRYATPEESGGWGLVVPAELVDGASRTHLLDVDGEVVASLIGRGETVSCPA